MRKFTNLLIICLAIIGIFLFPYKIYAATVTWDGEGTDGTCGGGAGDGNKWSCGANWSTNSVPTASDVATFGGTSTKNATIDSAISITGITINSGYTGTITQAATITLTTSGFNQDAGILIGGSQTIDINDGSFTVNSGGNFTSTSGTLSVERNFTIDSGATFSANNGSFLFDGSGSLDDSSLACGSKDFSSSTFSFTKTSYDGNVVISSDCTFNLGNSAISTAGTITNNGTITVGSGTWTINASFVQSDAGASTTFSGTTIDINSMGNSALGAGTLAITAGTFSADNFTTLNIEGSINNSGNKLPNGLSLTLNGVYVNADTTLVCGTATFASPVNITKAAYDGNVTIGSDCTINLGDSPTVSAGVITNNGTLV
ncbi:hypothetical protein COX08_00345, partial [Candidatus Beckwithbacteria bacterium CG23_combo_of_CG06-09_8_20_14_all_34_8]